MADVLRSCTKTGCRWPAAASLSYRYATRQVWLLDLVSKPDPSLYDLCPHHADHLVVPKGWDRVDDRSEQEVMVEMSASARAEAASRLRHPTTISARSHHLVPAGAGARNRYAKLVEQLPRLAAEAAASAAAEDQISLNHGMYAANVADLRDAETPDAAADDLSAAEAGETPEPAVRGAGGASNAAVTTDAPEAPETPALAPTATAPATPQPAVTAAVTPDAPDFPPATTIVSASRPPVVPSRDLAPMPPADRPWPGPEPTADAPDASATETPAETPPDTIPAPAETLPGQLAIPVDDLIEASDGVVVAFDFAGGRRRSGRS